MSTFRIGITPDFYTDAKGRFEAALESKLEGIAGLEFVPMQPEPNRVVSAESLNQFDAVFSLGIRYSADSFRGVTRPALIARWGVGYDMIDLAAASQADVLVAITPNAVRRPVAEAVLTFIFALAKNVMEQDRLVRTGKWRGSMSKLGTCVGDRVLGSIGCGNIGQELFRQAASLGFRRFIAYDPYVRPEVAAALNVELVSMEDVFRQSDFVTINCFLNEQTRGMVGEEQFRMMKPGAYFINTARGPIVQQAALVRALREKWIAGAGIDVFEQEPIDPNDPIATLDNVILAPHALAWTEEIARDNSLEACDNILAVFRGEVPAAAVNRDVLDRPGFREKIAAFGARHAGRGN